MKRRSDTPPQRYEPSGMLAVDPRAFLELFIVPSSRANELIGSTCVVDVCGPIEAHDTGWADSYEAIQQRVAEACESPASVIVLRVDSPGGAVKGCFDAVKALRRMCAEANKPLYAFCEYACSAGYAIASAAELVFAAESALVGSIGVVERRADYSAQNAANGLRVEFIASGTRKAYGNVDLPITDDELAAKKEVIDACAGVFFALVEETRGIKAADVAALQASVLHAEAAKGAGLVDEVTTFETLLARIASGKAMAMTAYEKARAALEEAAKGDDANAAVAKRALATMATGAGGDDDDADKPDPDAAEGDDDADAEKPAAGDGDAPADDDKPAKPKADPPAATAAATASSGGAQPSASDTHSVALAALAKAHTLEARLASGEARAERKRLLARREDFSKELRAELMKETTPIATVRNMVKTLPRVPVPGGAADLAARAGAAGGAAGGAPTRGAGQGTTDTLGSDPRGGQASEMDVRMGLVEQTLGVTRTRNFLQFGVVNKPVEAAAGGNGVTK
jgi:ClpP class serine protease